MRIKPFTLLPAFLFFANVSVAQMPPIIPDTIAPVLLSKKREVFLPEAKDWALSIDASPLLTYTGKLLSNAGADAPSVNALANYPFTIGGKYFVTNKEAIRARVRIGIASQSISNAVVDNQNTNLDTVYLKDSKKVSSSDITIAIGKEFRRGKTRLQGYYGGEGVLGISTGKSIYNYGNTFSNLNVSPTTTDFSTASSLGFVSGAANSRLKTDQNGTGIKIAARGFVGAEYFIFPKMSIGLEFGFSVMYYNLNEGKYTTETWDAASGSIKNKTLAKSGNKGFGVDNDNSGGAIMLNLHF